MRVVWIVGTLIIGAFASIALVQQQSYSRLTGDQKVLAASVQSIPYATDPSLPDLNTISSLINAQRSSNDLPALINDPQLAAVAKQRADDMASNMYYAHKSPDGTYFYDILVRDNYDVDFGCENLDLQFTLQPDIYVNDWLTSTNGHRECALHKGITRAGYATIKIPSEARAGMDIDAYIVVAIYADPK